MRRSGFVLVVVWSKKNETLRILLVSLCFGNVDVSGCVPPATHRCWSFHSCILVLPASMAVPPERRSLLAPSFPFSPLLSSSSMFFAALTSRFQKVALHQLLVQRKTFRLHLSTIFMLASLAGRGTRRKAVRHSAITERVDPRTAWSNTS